MLFFAGLLGCSRRNCKYGRNHIEHEWVKIIHRCCELPHWGGGIFGLRTYGKVPLENLKKHPAWSQIPENYSLLLIFSKQNYELPLKVIRTFQKVQIIAIQKLIFVQKQSGPEGSVFGTVFHGKLVFCSNSVQRFRNRIN